MKAEYRRDLQNNYLILELPEAGGKTEYEIRMAEQNAIPGLLPFHSSGRDGKEYLHYEITSKQPIKDVYDKKNMSCQDMILLLTGIETTLEMMQRYLLNPAQLVFDPEYIYLEPGKNKVWLCYLPGAGIDCSIALLAEFLLKRLDHEDGQAVMLGYSFYQKTTEENFSLQRTLKEMLTFSGKEEKTREAIFPERSEKTDTGEQLYEECDPKDRAQKLVQKPEDYEVIHKKRHLREKKGSKIEALFQVVHPAVLLSGLFLFAVLEILFYIDILHLTEAGGLFFLLISLEVLINKSWKKHEQKKKSGENRWLVEEEEDEMYHILQEEMYEKVLKSQPIEETRFLTPAFNNDCLRLIYLGTGNKGMEYPDITIGQKAITVGKIKGESDVILDSPTVSRIHALLKMQDGRYYLKDLNSKNGTFHNGRRLHPQQQCEIQDGDCISFAEIDYRAAMKKTI